MAAMMKDVDDEDEDEAKEEPAENDEENESEDETSEESEGESSETESESEPEVSSENLYDLNLTRNPNNGFHCRMLRMRRRRSTTSHESPGTKADWLPSKREISCCKLMLTDWSMKSTKFVKIPKNFNTIWIRCCLSWVNPWLDSLVEFAFRFCFSFFFVKRKEEMKDLLIIRCNDRRN